MPFISMSLLKQAPSRDVRGVFLVPFVGNAAEHFTAIKVVMEDKVDLSNNIAIAS
jgi:Ca2+/H+ antiporter